MAEVVGNVYNTLYQRPTVRLDGYCALHGLPGELLAYLNYGGPTGSAKYLSRNNEAHSFNHC